MRHNNHPKGDRLPQTKLTPEAVRQMRREYAKAYQQIHDLRKRYSTAAMAERHGVSVYAVRDAIFGKTWSHVE
jgi:hypothetical protein